MHGFIIVTTRTWQSYSLFVRKQKLTLSCFPCNLTRSHHCDLVLTSQQNELTEKRLWKSIYSVRLGNNIHHSVFTLLFLFPNVSFIQSVREFTAHDWSSWASQHLVSRGAHRSTRLLRHDQSGWSLGGLPVEQHDFCRAPCFVAKAKKDISCSCMHGRFVLTLVSVSVPNSYCLIDWISSMITRKCLFMASWSRYCYLFRVASHLPGILAVVKDWPVTEINLSPRRLASLDS